MHEFVKLLISEANLYSHGRNELVGFLSAVVMIITFIPVMVPHERDPGYTAFLVLNMVSTAAFGLTDILLLYCPISDFLWRKKMATLLNYVITVSTVRTEQTRLPTIDMFNPQNVYGWMYARLVIQSYRKRMLARLDCLVSVFLVVSILFTIILVVSLFAGEMLIDNAFHIQMFVLTLLCLFMLCFIVYMAATVNEEFARHKGNVNLNEMKANSRLLYVVDQQDKLLSQGKRDTEEFLKLQKEKVKLEEAMQAMKRVTEVIKISNDRYPLCVVGMPADMSILFSIITAIATLISSVVSIFLRTRDD